MRRIRLSVGFERKKASPERESKIEPRGSLGGWDSSRGTTRGFRRNSEGGDGRCAGGARGVRARDDDARGARWTRAMMRARRGPRARMHRARAPSGRGSSRKPADGRGARTSSREKEPRSRYDGSKFPSGGSPSQTSMRASSSSSVRSSSESEAESESESDRSSSDSPMDWSSAYGWAPPSRKARFSESRDASWFVARSAAPPRASSSGSTSYSATNVSAASASSTSSSRLGGVACSGRSELGSCPTPPPTWGGFCCVASSIVTAGCVAEVCSGVSGWTVSKRARGGDRSSDIARSLMSPPSARRRGARLGCGAERGSGRGKHLFRASHECLR